MPKGVCQHAEEGRVCSDLSPLSAWGGDRELGYSDPLVVVVVVVVEENEEGICSTPKKTHKRFVLFFFFFFFFRLRLLRCTKNIKK